MRVMVYYLACCLHGLCCLLCLSRCKTSAAPALTNSSLSAGVISVLHLSSTTLSLSPWLVLFIIMRQGLFVCSNLFLISAMVNASRCYFPAVAQSKAAAEKEPEAGQGG